MPPTKHEVYDVSRLQARSREAEWEQLQTLPEADRLREAHNAAVAERIGWDPILGEFNFDRVVHWAEGRAPMRVLAQLFDQVIDTGMIVTWRKQKYLVVDLDIRPQELFRRFTLDHLTAYRRAVTIVPLKYFNLNA